MITTSNYSSDRSEYAPHSCILLYKKVDHQSQHFHSRDDDKFVALQHRSLGTDKNGDPILGAGKLVTDSVIKSILKSLREEQRLTFIPQNVMAFTDDAIAWFVPSKPRTIWTHLSRSEFQEKTEPHKVKSLHPSLLFIATKQKFRCFAMKTDSRPDIEDMLYLPPYFNMYKDGSMCVGNTPFPDAPSLSNYTQYEKAYFSSVFTHPNEKMTSHPEGDYGLWREIAKNPKAPFPVEYLVPYAPLKDVLGG